MANSSVHRDVGRERDLRIDLVRGIALLVLFSDHIRGNVVSQYTPLAVGLSDMADVFVFLSGYSCGLSYGRRMNESGFWNCCRRAWLRAAQVFAAKIVMTVIALSFMLQARQWVTPYFFGVAWNLDLVEHYPLETLVEVQLYRLELFQFFVLALYTPFLLVLPPILLGLRASPRMMIAGSALLYVTVQLFPDTMRLPPPWREALFFNPYAWQFLFFFACAMALTKSETHSRFKPRLLTLVAAMIVLTVGVAVHCLWTIPPGRLTDKPNLGVLRLAHFVAVLVVGLWIVPKSVVLAKWTLLRPILVCGRYPLIGYCAGGFLAILGEASLNAFSRNWPMTLSVNVAGWGGCLAATAIWDLIWTARRPGLKTDINDVPAPALVRHCQ